MNVQYLLTTTERNSATRSDFQMLKHPPRLFAMPGYGFASLADVAFPAQSTVGSEPSLVLASMK